METPYAMNRSIFSSYDASKTHLESVLFEVLLLQVRFNLGLWFKRIQQIFFLLAFSSPSRNRFIPTCSETFLKTIISKSKQSKGISWPLKYDFMIIWMNLKSRGSPHPCDWRPPPDRYSFLWRCRGSNSSARNTYKLALYINSKCMYARIASNPE